MKLTKWMFYRARKRKNVIVVIALLCLAMLVIRHGLLHAEFHCHLETNPKRFPRGGLGTTIKLTADFYPNRLNSLCNVSNLTAIIPINSAVPSFNKRHVLREAMGHVCRDHICRFFFLLGASSNEYVMAKVKQEIKTHGDILMIDKNDTYRNINNKLVAMLQWLNKYCTTPKYVIFMNDDTFMNFDLILHELEASGGVNCSCIICNIVRLAQVKRDPSNKWHVTTDEYPCNFYPNYCTGPAYGFPNVVTSKLLSGVFNTSYVWPDDAWLTGFVRDHVGVKLVPSAKDIMLQEDGVYLDVKYFHRYFYVHNVSLEQMKVVHMFKGVQGWAIGFVPVLLIVFIIVCVAYVLLKRHKS